MPVLGRAVLGRAPTEDSKALARDNIDRARKRAMKSVTDVERDKAERWGKD
jgi:hypothetical protein